MRVRNAPSSRIALFLVLGVIVLAASLAATPSWADSTGVLKLKVMRCLGSQWISNAEVDVILYRPGTGQIGSATGYTSSTGYVEFSFTNLQGTDQAHVTVTPSGESPDASHTYEWIQSNDRTAGYWDLGVQGDSQCEDIWFDQKADIIECLYH